VAGCLSKTAADGRARAGGEGPSRGPSRGEGPRACSESGLTPIFGVDEVDEAAGVTAAADGADGGLPAAAASAAALEPRTALEPRP